MQKARNGLVVLSVAALLVACGGGGGSATPSTPVTVTPTPPVAETPAPIPAPTPAPDPVPTPIPVLATSYANAKEQGLQAITLPKDAEYADAYAQADFKQDGNLMLFAAILKYDVKNPATIDTPSVFQFYRKNGAGAWILEANMIDTPVGCVHPRKAAVADFNNDGRPDILVACTGFDAEPFAGEENFLVLSTASGVYTSKPIPSTPGYFHGAAAADFNGDGNVDFVVTDTTISSKGRMFLGNGNGTFTENTLLPDVLAKEHFFTVEATDVNGDGKVDLLLGADEYPTKSSSQIVIGDGTGNFKASRVIGLPKEPEHGTILDFVVKNHAIYALRTSSKKENFYETKAIQKIDMTTLAGTTVFAVNGKGWIKWLIPTATGVVSDNAQNPGGASY